MPISRHWSRRLNLMGVSDTSSVPKRPWPSYARSYGQEQKSNQCRVGGRKIFPLHRELSGAATSTPRQRGQCSLLTTLACAELGFPAGQQSHSVYTGSVHLKAVRQQYQSVIPLNSCTAVQLYRSVQTQQSAEGYGRLLCCSQQRHEQRHIRPNSHGSWRLQSSFCTGRAFTC